MDIAIGDVVELKSGGPQMSVQFQNTETKLWYCVWFVNGVRLSNEFEVLTLKKVKSLWQGKKD